MGLLRDIGVELIVAGAAFVLGLAASRVLRSWVYFRARRFWRPLATKDLAIILGEGFSNLAGFEASGLVGRGDLIASNQLVAHLSAMGMRRLRLEFADRAQGVDPTGHGLRRNLIVVGGQDANTLTKACLKRLRCSYEFDEEISPTSNLEEGHLVDRPTPVPPRLRASRYAEGESRLFEPVMVDNQVARDYGVIIRTRNPFLFEHQRDKRVVLIFGCYGLGTHAAALFVKEQMFLDLVKNTEDDIECIVACDAVGQTPQAVRHVFIKHYPSGALCKPDFLIDESPAFPGRNREYDSK